MKQVFAQRYNREDGRTGHIWGDRYGSRILEGEPPVEEGGEASNPGVRPYGEERTAKTVFPPTFPFPAAPATG
jgi:hypothetical protein